MMAWRFAKDMITNRASASYATHGLEVSEVLYAAVTGNPIMAWAT